LSYCSRIRVVGGESGIRTHDTFNSIHAFQACDGSVNSGAGYGYFSDCTHPARQGRSSIYNTTGNELKIYTCLKLNDPLIVTTLKIY